MNDEMESLRLRLEHVLEELAQQEAADMRLDPNLLTEMTYLISYFRQERFAINVLREGQSLTVRIEKRRE